MALTLGTTLAAAQNSRLRKPLVEVKSLSFEEDLPLDGAYFNEDDEAEEMPGAVLTTGSRIAVVFVRDESTLVYKYSDTSKTIWTEVEVVEADGTIEGASLVEQADGNIMIVYVDDTGSSRKLRTIVVSPTGETVESYYEIGSYAEATATIRDPFVIRMSNGNYLLVYSHYDPTGPTYRLYSRIGTAYDTWNAESALNLSGLDDEHERSNPALIESSLTNEILLFFDHVDDIDVLDQEMRNIYVAISADFGVTWGVPTAVTDYDTFSTIGQHPYPAERDDNSIELAYYERTTVLIADETSDNYVTSPVASCSNSPGTGLHYDAATGYLYWLHIYTGSGNKVLCGVSVIDVDSWSIIRTYTETTTPSYNSMYATEQVWPMSHKGQGKYVCFGTVGNTVRQSVCVINDQLQTVTDYIFNYDIAAYGVTHNVEFTVPGLGVYLKGTQIDEANDRLYVLFYRALNDYLGGCHLVLGWIDLTEAPNPSTGMYTFNVIIDDDTDWEEEEMLGDGWFKVFPDNGYIVVGFAGIAFDYKGRMKVYSLSSGNVIKDYNNVDYPSYHYRGSYPAALYGDKLYCGFPYESGYGESNKRGLMQIDLTTDAIFYFRPTWATVDEYAFINETISMGDGRILASSYGYGVTIFTIADGSWELFDNNTVPGMTPSGEEDFMPVEYASDRHLIFSGQGYYASNWLGVIAFSEYGEFRQLKYRTGTPGTPWTWGAQNDLSSGIHDYDAAIIIDENDEIWAVWDRKDDDEISLKWDKEGSEFDLTPYLLASSAVSVKWEIEHLATLKFECSYGHLFDPSNLSSLLSGYLRKGKRITLRFGDEVAGVEYWQNQGTYVVKEISLSFPRKGYPTISVTAEDKRTLWFNQNIVATPVFNGIVPDEIMSDVIEDYAGWDATEISLSSLDTEHSIYHQFVDSTIEDIIKDLCDHFGYFPYMNVNAKFTVKRIDLTAAAVHQYTDSTMLIEFSPDDSYSNFTNRIRVVGESRDYVDVTYPYEAVAELDGTIGWWAGIVGDANVFRVYYSTDRNRKCINPYLEVNKSVTENPMMKSGTETITATDTIEYLWCEVTITVPNRLWLFIGELVMFGAVIVCGFVCTMYCGVCSVMLAILMMLYMETLGMISNYSYTIFAQPLGEEKMMVQGIANDTDAQRELGGVVIEEEIEDPFCYEVDECTRVAEEELAIIKAQRRRLTFQKLAHLADEIGDTVTVVHPYSGLTLTIFIAGLERTYRKPSGPNSDDGSFIDRIDGWRIE